MKRTIPTTKIWRQPNRDEYSGELYATRGVDLVSLRGKIIPARSVVVSKDNTDDAQLEYPTAFVRSSADGTDRWWALTNTVVFKTTDSTTTDFTQDNIASSSTLCSHLVSDMVDFNGTLLTSKSTDIAQLSAGTWTQTWYTGTLAQASLSTNTFHPMFVGFQNILLIGDGRNVHTIDTSNRVRKNRVSLRNGFEIRWIRGNSNSYFIGADNSQGENGKVFEWDGISENFNREYDIFSDISFACAVKNEIPYVFNRNGQLLRFNGGGFTEVARLPIAHTVFATNTSSYFNVWLQDNWTDMFSVSQNGMDVIDGNIHILLNGALAGNSRNLLDSMPSGIYEYDENIGLYHKYALSKYKSGSRADFGSNSIYRAGALKNKNNHNLLAGYTLFTDLATTERSCISTLSGQIENRGYIITPKIQTPGELEKWQRLWSKFFLKSSTDKIIPKIKREDSTTTNFRANSTWVDATSFTTTTAGCSGEGTIATASVGDEIEVLNGHGSGIVAHITSISNNAGTYTVGIDETLATIATTTANIQFRNWKKLGTIDNNTTNPKGFDTTGTPTSWTQYKIELRGIYDGCQLEEIQIISNSDNGGTS